MMRSTGVPPWAPVPAVARKRLPSDKGTPHWVMLSVVSVVQVFAAPCRPALIVISVPLLLFNVAEVGSSAKNSSMPLSSWPAEVGLASRSVSWTVSTLELAVMTAWALSGPLIPVPEAIQVAAWAEPTPEMASAAAPAMRVLNDIGLLAPELCHGEYPAKVKPTLTGRIGTPLRRTLPATGEVRPPTGERTPTDAIGGTAASG